MRRALLRCCTHSKGVGAKQGPETQINKTRKRQRQRMRKKRAVHYGRGLARHCLILGVHVEWYEEKRAKKGKT